MTASSATETVKMEAVKDQSDQPQTAQPVDLRSDTVTRPTPEMRRAMAEAEVGDDVYGEDPTVNRLQARAAEVFGREAALFVPSGSMGNLIAIKVWTHHGNEVICEERGHINQFEMGAMSAVAGCLPRPIFVEDGILTWQRIEPLIQPHVYARAQTGLISLESSHNMAGGTVYPVEVSDEICDRAHSAGLPVHLDGARIFNAAVALNVDVKKLTRGFDTVMFCLSKGLGAPVGSMLVGSAELMARARVFRKALGGGMRQAGILAAAGLIALEEGPARLKDDHANARLLAEALANTEGVSIDLATVETNIVIFRLTAGSGAAELAKRLKARGVMAGAFGPDAIRLVTHRDVTRGDCIDAAEALTEEIEAATVKAIH
jgi:threonine aldolase